MNFKEGLRRIGLAAGVIGACLGLFTSYLHGTDIHYQRERHSRFETLLNSPAVQRDICFLTKDLSNAQDQTTLSKVYEQFHDGQNMFNAVAATSGDADGWIVNAGGVSRIYFDKKEQVTSIQDSEHNTFYSDPNPSILSYIVILVWPIIGFLIPWGVVKGFSWIVAGFSHRPA